MCVHVKLRQLNLNEIYTTLPSTYVIHSFIGASKRLNSLIVRDSWVTVGDSPPAF